MTDRELERRFSAIPWREPLRVTRVDGFSGYACRFCIAQHGLTADAVPFLPDAPEAVAQHIKERHPR